MDDGEFWIDDDAAPRGGDGDFQESASILLSPDQQTFVHELRSREHVCAWCGVPYYELENIGTWRCWGHLELCVGGTWLCCQKLAPERGCVRTHHNDVREVVREPLYLSRAVEARIATWLDDESKRDVGGELQAMGYSRSIERFSEVDVRIVNELHQDAEAARKHAHVTRNDQTTHDQRQHNQAALRYRPASRQEMAEQLTRLGIERRFWFRAMAA